jgi:two-component system cell cycle sensor histidine kinase/response regulator CckA
MEQEKISILIVEDEGIVALDLENRLEGLGYSVSGIAATGKDAIRKAAEMHPDLVLMDIRLRGDMDGIEAARAIQARSHIPVVYITALADQDTLQRSETTGHQGYVVKPLEDAELRVVIETALASTRQPR